ncbi:MAG TPA: hypothetical protein PKH92_04970 [Anaerolineaceae bacterium]|nr:hypothetical protein [Anaerolineaceae bacterium]
MARKHKTINLIPDDIFEAAEMDDPFMEHEEMMEVFLTLPLKDRRRLAQQAVILCSVCEGLDPIGALEVLEALGKWAAKGGDLKPL